MKRFLIKVLFAAGVALVVAVSVIALRIALAQEDVRAAFAVPPGTEVVFIGNSHTGCSFTEAPEFRNRVLWYHSMGFTFHYVRFLELERRGALDHGVKACVFDCDTSTIHCCSKRLLKENFWESLPFAWRYAPMILSQSCLRTLEDAFSNVTASFALQGCPPLDEANWTTWPLEKKRKCLVRFYGEKWTELRTWDTDDFPSNMPRRFDEMVRDLKTRCDKRGIRLIFFASPLASDAPDRVNPVIWRQVENLGRRVQELGAEFYDFRCAYPDEKFRDAGHLLRRSAYDFTKKFYAEVLKPTVSSDTK